LANNCQFLEEFDYIGKLYKCSPFQEEWEERRVGGKEKNCSSIIKGERDWKEIIKLSTHYRG
jgi:hypothetical protein